MPEDVAPEGLGVLSDIVLAPLALRVVEKGAEEAGVEMVQDVDQEVFVELEEEGKLAGHLPHAVDELVEEYQRLVFLLTGCMIMNTQDFWS